MEAEEKRCPQCDELVRAAALKCKHCGSSLAPEESGLRQVTKAVLVSVAAVVGAVLAYNAYQSARPRTPQELFEQRMEQAREFGRRAAEQQH